MRRVIPLRSAMQFAEHGDQDIATFHRQRTVIVFCSGFRARPPSRTGASVSASSSHQLYSSLSSPAPPCNRRSVLLVRTGQKVSLEMPLCLLDLAFARLFRSLALMVGRGVDRDLTSVGARYHAHEPLGYNR